VRENRSPGSEGEESLEGLFSTPIDYMDVFELAIHGTGYPLPGGYDELLAYLCITTSAPAWERVNCLPTPCKLLPVPSLWQSSSGLDRLIPYP